MLRSIEDRPTFKATRPRCVLSGCHLAPRSYLLMSLPEEGDNKLTDAKLQGYAAVLSIGSTRCKANTLGTFQQPHR